MNNSSSADLVNPETSFSKKHALFDFFLTIEVFASLSGNLLFMISYFKLKQGTSNMYIVMWSLSLVDFVTGLVTGTSLVRHFSFSYETEFEICRYQTLLLRACFIVNIYHLFIMAVDRYIALTMPFR